MIFLVGHGHVHNMAVMVAPNKVDYSVTKVSQPNMLYGLFSSRADFAYGPYCLFSYFYVLLC